MSHAPDAHGGHDAHDSHSPAGHTQKTSEFIGKLPGAANSFFRPAGAVPEDSQGIGKTARYAIAGILSGALMMAEAPFNAAGKIIGFPGYVIDETRLKIKSALTGHGAHAAHGEGHAMAA